MTIRALIADDEPVARRRIRRLLQQATDVEVVGQCGDGAAAVDAIRTLAPDVVFLDVQMPELDGFAVLQAIGADAMPGVIFVTAFDEYAIRAFDVHALDYLLKPVDGDRLLRAVDRARSWLGDRRRPRTDPRLEALLARLSSDRRFLTRLPVRFDGRLLVVDLSDVDWMGAADNYVALHVGTREMLVRGTMGQLERELDPSRFVRVHRSTIVRVDRIRELSPLSHGDFALTLEDGTRLTMSRGYRTRVEHLLGRPL
jgi:two-component system LytT family response regulator